MTAVDVLRELGVRIIDDVIDSELRSDALARALTDDTKPAELYRDGAVLDEAVRRTKVVRVGKDITGRLASQFLTLQPTVEALHSIALAECEPPQVLRYEPGDFFVAHVDGSPAPGSPTATRAVSAVLFLNGPSAEGGEPCFTGGGLLFRLADDDEWARFGLAVEPRAGRLVTFPSSLMHEVQPVVEGVRCTCVTWYLRSASSESALAGAAEVGASTAPADA